MESAPTDYNLLGRHGLLFLSRRGLKPRIRRTRAGNAPTDYNFLGRRGLKPRILGNARLTA
ncbi:hypothetical protein C6495_03915 [Candidatus Poribacteria bacterium]|nr:MAG: hypothetical protein C6495_03915 [Candidatus Poribacteria bacterium]